MEIWPLLSSRMWPTRVPTEDGKGELQYWYFNWSGGWSILRPQDVLHFRGPTIDGLMGRNMVAQAARAIGSAMAQERFASSYFGNNATLGTILKYPKTLSEQAYNRLKADWEEKHSGPSNAHKPFILEGGMELQELTRNVQELQLVDSRVFSIEEICRFWGVPPHKVQHLARATFNTLEHLGIEFTRDALTPWVKRLCQEVDYKLFPQRAPWRNSNIDTDWLQHGDAKSRWEAHQIGRRIGVLSANDIRRKEKLNTLGETGEIRLVESNLTTIEGIEQQVEKLKADTARAKDPPPPPPQLPGEAPEVEEPGEEEGPLLDPLALEVGAYLPGVKPVPAKESLRSAVELLVSGSLERYQRKLSNREKDLRRKASRSEVEIRNALAELRAESMEILVGEIAQVLSILASAGVTAPEDLQSTVLLTVDSMDNGRTSCDAAVQAVLTKLLGDPTP
jgi:hypothetical protein